MKVIPLIHCKGCLGVKELGQTPLPVLEEVKEFVAAHIRCPQRG